MKRVPTRARVARARRESEFESVIDFSLRDYERREREDAEARERERELRDLSRRAVEALERRNELRAREHESRELETQTKAKATHSNRREHTKWHADLERVFIAANLNMTIGEAIAALTRLEDEGYDQDEEGNLLLPGDRKVKRRTVENKLTDIRKRLTSSRREKP